MDTLDTFVIFAIHIAYICKYSQFHYIRIAYIITPSNETKEIKKAWTAMSRKLKKTGMNYTCVMNAKPFADQLARSRSNYADLIASEPVKAFMEATGAKVHLENVPDGYYTKVYARFSY